MAVLCVLLGLKVRQVKEQQAAIDLVRKARESIAHSYQVDEEVEELDFDANPPGPDWLCNRIGAEFVSSVCWVQMAEARDLLPLTRLTGLREVNLPRLHVNDLSELASLTQLQGLMIGGEDIDDLSPLAGMIRLKGLCVSCPNVSDISAVAKMSNLQALFVNDSQVADLSPLSGLTELVEVYLSNTEVTDLSPLASSGPYGLIVEFHQPDFIVELVA